MNGIGIEMAVLIAAGGCMLGVAVYRFATGRSGRAGTEAALVGVGAIMVGAGLAVTGALAVALLGLGTLIAVSGALLQAWSRETRGKGQGDTSASSSARRS